MVWGPLGTPQTLLGAHNYMTVILKNMIFQVLPKEMYQP